MHWFWPERAAEVYYDLRKSCHKDSSRGEENKFNVVGVETILPISYCLLAFLFRFYIKGLCQFLIKNFPFSKCSNLDILGYFVLLNSVCTFLKRFLSACRFVQNVIFLLSVLFIWFVFSESISFTDQILLVLSDFFSCFRLTTFRNNHHFYSLLVLSSHVSHTLPQHPTQ